MKINWTLFYSYLLVWIVVGAVIFDNIAPMIIFIICGGVCGGLILAVGKKKRKACS
ncbi:hypothetical protein [Virgibacillus alimentarius]|uniref:Uncharacterized protein n=1 Tax=Virgibacillus alimentarius TaxID=698769 RepID=A0ABS4S802_9BACI|nr:MULTISPECIES: hypothetical protein [Virgibacillus]MBP2257621.1 hypothetical protein [Virgibacillus alimentarius]HLR69703.1 hypothetical protein [Virgibacillus sp.]